ncbi:cellulose biosynthesis protein BcsR [Pseudomonas rhodesiae]|uniref:cellulose biosynthesis protein BcsR n=1 Tax=Pseudomonas rhodesiae TaxID=76760 RepID=UPI00289DC6FE|nr:cellulose biosynthesis protein BcsR [Pseudomonas rhodesiae]
MAAVPSAFQVKAQVQSRAARADDIARLKQKLELPELDYVDISAQLELQKALHRWPLLAEMERLQPRVLPVARQSELEMLS